MAVNNQTQDRYLFCAGPLHGAVVVINKMMRGVKVEELPYVEHPDVKAESVWDLVDFVKRFDLSDMELLNP